MMNPKIIEVFEIPSTAKIEKINRTWVCHWEDKGTPFYLVLESGVIRLRVGELEKDQTEPFRNWGQFRIMNLGKARDIRRIKHSLVVNYRKHLKSTGAKIKVQTLAQDLMDLIEKHKTIGVEIGQSKNEWLLELSQVSEKFDEIVKEENGN